MQLAKIIGSMVSTRKCERLEGLKLLVASKGRAGHRRATATSCSGGSRRAPMELGLEEGIDGEILGERRASSRGVQRRA